MTTPATRKGRTTNRKISSSVWLELERGGKHAARRRRSATRAVKVPDTGVSGSRQPRARRAVDLRAHGCGRRSRPGSQLGQPRARRGRPPRLARWRAADRRGTQRPATPAPPAGCRRAPARSAGRSGEGVGSGGPRRRRQAGQPPAAAVGRAGVAELRRLLRRAVAPSAPPSGRAARQAHHQRLLLLAEAHQVGVDGADPVELAPCARFAARSSPAVCGPRRSRTADQRQLPVIEAEALSEDMAVTGHGAPVRGIHQAHQLGAPQAASAAWTTRSS